MIPQQIVNVKKNKKYSLYYYYNYNYKYLLIVCEYPCLECDSSTVCTSCHSDYKRIDTQSCRCEDKFYDDKEEKECKMCQYPCLTCVDSKDNCTSCLDYDNRDGETCECHEGFYDHKFMTKCDRKIYVFGDPFL